MRVVFYLVFIFIVIRMIKKANKNISNNTNGNNISFSNISNNNTNKINTYNSGNNSSYVSSDHVAETKRRLQEHFGMPTGRIHDEIHENHEHNDSDILCRANKDSEEYSTDILAEYQSANVSERLDFEESDLIKEINDVMVCGYSGRDFLSEGLDLINNINI